MTKSNDKKYKDKILIVTCFTRCEIDEKDPKNKNWKFGFHFLSKIMNWTILQKFSQWLNKIHFEKTLLNLIININKNNFNNS